MNFVPFYPLGLSQTLAIVDTQLMSCSQRKYLFDDPSSHRQA